MVDAGSFEQTRLRLPEIARALGSNATLDPCRTKARILLQREPQRGFGIGRVAALSGFGPSEPNRLARGESEEQEQQGPHSHRYRLMGLALCPGNEPAAANPPNVAAAATPPTIAMVATDAPATDPPDPPPDPAGAVPPGGFASRLTWETRITCDAPETGVAAGSNFPISSTRPPTSASKGEVEKTSTVTLVTSSVTKKCPSRFSSTPVTRVAVLAGTCGSNASTVPCTIFAITSPRAFST
jgi:hypothetical protein